MRKNKDRAKLEKLCQVFCDYGPIPRHLLEKFKPTIADTEREGELRAYESGLDWKTTELLRNDPSVLFSVRHAFGDSHNIVLLRSGPTQGITVSRAIQCDPSFQRM